MAKDNMFMGVAALGGVGLGYALSKLVGSKMPAEVAAQAERINAVFAGGTLWLDRVPIFSFTDQGRPAGLYAFTLTYTADPDPIMQHKNNPEAILCLRQLATGWEFAVASMSGLVVNVYLDGALRLVVPPLLTVFIA